MKAKEKKPADPSGFGLPKFYFRRDEAAWSLGISVQAIDIHISRQELTTRPYGRKRLIPAEDVKRLADRIMKGELYEGCHPSPK